MLLVNRGLNDDAVFQLLPGLLALFAFAFALFSSLLLCAARGVSE
jgi:hypothetical protein